MLDHFSLRMLETLGAGSLFIQHVEQLERIEDSLVGIILIQSLLPLVNLTHILQQNPKNAQPNKHQETKTACFPFMIKTTHVVCSRM